MRCDSVFRVMWLLNHTSARRFEVAMLKSIGIAEIYTPKIYPSDINFRSASVDYTEDSSLSLPPHVINELNQINWYESAKPSDWQLASRYFDACFFIAQNRNLVKNISRHFEGLVIWRAYGLDRTLTYGKILRLLTREGGEDWIKKLGRRFFFAQAYPHLSEIEPSFLSRRAVYLPLGLDSSAANDEWRGRDARIFFVCPDIGINRYYENVYKWFLDNFGELPYAIGGSQPSSVDNPSVLGFVSAENHARNMREFRLMFYHSQESHHVHYHPFEAVRVGMPLIFMSGGMLDLLGGQNLPGRCQTLDEARSKITRLLRGDAEFAEEIRAKQVVLLDSMNPANLRPIWEQGFQQMIAELGSYRQIRKPPVCRQKRVAIILPAAYKGGSLRGAQLLAEAVRHGSAEAGEPADVVFLYPEAEGDYTDEDFSDLHQGIKRRTFHWKYLEADEARRAMRYAGYDDWEPTSARYAVINDGIRQLQDCDLLLIVSDRLTAPILPLRPVVHMVYDYLQRYVPFLSRGADQSFLDAARAADRVFVTTHFTLQDATQYAGLRPENVVKLPMLSPSFSGEGREPSTQDPDYFVWTTNAAMHKNHAKALSALQIYYERLGGTLRCAVTGVGTSDLLTTPPAHLRDPIAAFKRNRGVSKQVTWSGNLPDSQYRSLLSGAAFIWHPGSIDNGTFCVVEAASLGVPSLSSDYPAMREIDQQFELRLAWMDSSNAFAMAIALKEMESGYKARRALLPRAETLASQSVHQLSGEYWKAIRECL